MSSFTIKKIGWPLNGEYEKIKKKRTNSLDLSHESLILQMKVYN